MSESTLTKDQAKTYGPRPIAGWGENATIRVKVRFDDQCGNGHNTFAITATISCGTRGGGAGGCLHEEIAKVFPELAPFIKWHLCSTDGPLHYVANTVYHASERDHNGLLAGEFRQHTSRGKQNNGVEGVPNWVLEIPKGVTRDVYATEKPASIVLDWQPYGRTGEGKTRDLDAARRCAVWLDATDEDLIAPGLKERLEARLPALLAEFRQAVESLGFAW